MCMQYYVVFVCICLVHLEYVILQTDLRGLAPRLPSDWTMFALINRHHCVPICVLRPNLRNEKWAATTTTKYLIYMRQTQFSLTLISLAPHSLASILVPVPSTTALCNRTQYQLPLLAIVYVLVTNCHIYVCLAYLILALLVGCDHALMTI